MLCAFFNLLQVSIVTTCNLDCVRCSFQYLTQLFTLRVILEVKSSKKQLLSVEFLSFTALRCNEASSKCWNIAFVVFFCCCVVDAADLLQLLFKYGIVAPWIYMKVNILNHKFLTYPGTCRNSKYVHESHVRKCSGSINLTQG